MDPYARLVRFSALLALAVTPAVALAQTPPATKSPVSPKAMQNDPKACAEGRATVGQGGSVGLQKQPGSNLSEKLAQSNGVICPPANVDPAIREPTPPGGSTMPVIPPPGTSGGNPNVQPK